MTKQRTSGKDHLLRNGNWSASFSQEELDFVFTTQMVWNPEIKNYVRPEGHPKAGKIVGCYNKQTRYWQITIWYKGRRLAGCRHQYRFYEKKGYIPSRVDHFDGNRENDDFDNLRDQADGVDFNKILSPSSLNILNSENSTPDYPKGLTFSTKRGDTWRVTVSDLTLGIRRNYADGYLRAKQYVKDYPKDQFEEALADLLYQRTTRHPRVCWPQSLCRSHDDNNRGPYSFYFYGGTVWTEEEKAA